MLRHPLSRRLLFLLGALVFPYDSQAQDVVGFRFGLDIANIGGDTSALEDLSPRVGFVAGIFGTFPLRHGFSLQPEILYAQKGFSSRATISDTDTPGNGDRVAARLELTYIDLPLLIQYSAPVASSSALSFYAGPVISFELAERIVLDGLQGFQESDQFGSPAYGFAIGSDVTGALLGIDGLFGVRYSRGLGNVLNEEVDGAERSSIYNQTFSLFVGVHLR